MINSIAVNGIRDIIEESWQAHGWSIPAEVQALTVNILASKIDKNPWQPEPSYAEQYLTIRTAQQALELGNTCWFTRAVFPELKSRHGITSSYYVQLGQGCYTRVLQEVDHRPLRLLRDHFEFIAEAAYTAIRHYGQFREMWD